MAAFATNQPGSWNVGFRPIRNHRQSAPQTGNGQVPDGPGAATQLRETRVTYVAGPPTSRLVNVPLGTSWRAWRYIDHPAAAAEPEWRSRTSVRSWAERAAASSSTILVGGSPSMSTEYLTEEPRA
jgi:hypothetical protein